MKLLIGLFRCFLLRAPPGGTFSHSANIRFYNHAFHFELLLVSFAGRSDNRILRQRQPEALKIFLQKRFRVFAQRLRIQSFQYGSEKRCDDLLGLRQNLRRGISRRVSPPMCRRE